MSDSPLRAQADGTVGGQDTKNYDVRKYPAQTILGVFVAGRDAEIPVDDWHLLS